MGGVEGRGEGGGGGCCGCMGGGGGSFVRVIGAEKGGAPPLQAALGEEEV